MSQKGKTVYCTYHQVIPFVLQVMGVEYPSLNFSRSAHPIPVQKISMLQANAVHHQKRISKEFAQPK